MLINVFVRENDTAEEDLVAGEFNDPRNLGHILGVIFEEYDDEFEIRIEVLNESLETARRRPLC